VRGYAVTVFSQAPCRHAVERPNPSSVGYADTFSLWEKVPNDPQQLPGLSRFSTQIILLPRGAP
jgi:hypothetical protein